MIVLDKFHALRLFHQAIDEIRRRTAWASVTVFSRHENKYVSAHLLRHETKHSDQMAMAAANGGPRGQLLWMVRYGLGSVSAWLIGTIHGKDRQWECYHGDEIAAGLKDGEYNSC